MNAHWTQIVEQTWIRAGSSRSWEAFFEPDFNPKGIGVDLRYSAGALCRATPTFTQSSRMCTGRTCRLTLASSGHAIAPTTRRSSTRAAPGHGDKDGTLLLQQVREAGVDTEFIDTR